MEEKERYEYFFGTNTIKDNKTNQFYGCVVDLLNQQDKRIKELEEELKNYKLCRCVDCSSEYEYGLETSIDELEKENHQLKQQLAESETQLKEEIEEKNGVRRALSACNRQNDEFADMIKKLVNEKEELKQQLVKSEKEHELLIDQFEEETEKLRKQIKQESDARKRFVEEVKNLKQQLHDLPKKIVEEIKLQLFNHFKVKNIEEYEKLPLIDSLFTTDTVIEILDTILEKFGGKDEINND